MLQIPKNVMQIGETNPHTKIYMEDYVHTFLERFKSDETLLVFGKKEEQDNIFYYMIYGVEKKVDWDRGSYPYFKKYDRIGTIEGAKGRRTFRPVRGAGISLNGYFVFYEQNADMQSYMIAVRETEDMAGSEEKEKVMEAVQTRRELHRKEREEKKAESGPVYRRDSEGTHAVRRKRLSMPAVKMGQKKAFSIPDLCRIGSLALLLILVVLGLTSINRYPDMKAVTEIFSDAVKATGNGQDREIDAAGQSDENSLIVEETANEEEGEIVEAVLDGQTEEEPMQLAQDDSRTVNWRIGQTEEEEQAQEPVSETQMNEGQAQTDADGTQTDADGAQTDADQVQTDTTQAQTDTAQAQTDEGQGQKESQTETKRAELDTEASEEAAQAIVRPESYVVKKGDSLAEISRKFYGSASKVKDICTANQIENPDQIHPGQNILLP